MPIRRRRASSAAPSSLPSTVPADASALYARNVFSFASLLLGADGAVRVWDVVTGQLVGTLCEGNAVVAISSGASRVAALSGDGRIRVWDVSVIR